MVTETPVQACTLQYQGGYGDSCHESNDDDDADFQL